MRTFGEAARAIDGLEGAAEHKAATPVNWKQREEMIIAGSVSDEDAKQHQGGEARHSGQAVALSGNPAASSTSRLDSRFR